MAVLIAIVQMSRYKENAIIAYGKKTNVMTPLRFVRETFVAKKSLF